ncbi:MAG: MATE family efflux transporter, partial [Spirochaetales bacterium]
NFGAGNAERANKAFKCLLSINFIFSFFMVGTVLVFPRVFIGLFTPNTELIEAGVMPLRIYLFGMAFMGIQSACQQAFVATGRAKTSIFIAMLRKLILLIPLAIILPKINNWGLWGIFASEPISDIIAATTTLLLFLSVRKTIFISKK